MLRNKNFQYIQKINKKINNLNLDILEITYEIFNNIKLKKKFLFVGTVAQQQ